MEAVVLAAGKSTRMKSNTSKILHKICSKPVIFYVLKQLKGLKTHIVVNKDVYSEVLSMYKDAEVHIQESQKGTGDALKSALPFIKEDSFVVVNGDTPLIKREDIDKAKELFDLKGLDCVVLTARLSNPFGYGRIVKKGEKIEIVEEKDADEKTKKINEINSGIYIFKTAFAKDAIVKILNNNKSNEYYLTDIIKHTDKIETIEADEENVLGINTRKDLAMVRKIIQKNIIERFDNVTFIAPESIYVDYDTTIGQDTVIFPNVSLRGNTKIGKNCVVDTGSVIKNSALGDNVHIKPYSVIEQSSIENNAQIGPFAHLRPQSEIGEEVKIGNFVEVKKSILKKGTKASHLTYIGDAELGEDVNVGCGTITCNYDGYKKNKTIIGDRVFIGSDVQLVAPVEVEHDSLIAAGTTVTQHVEPYSLAMSRVPQVTKPGWVKRYREKMEKLLNKKKQ
jgi:bifunctional UDP-N-acetylglucosamine pyrophosphorylase/glucosamine-1-phosphate N-acetyltransferase